LFFFKKKKNHGGILEKKKKKKSEWLNCNNLKVFFWGVKCHILNIGGQSANGWIVQGGKVHFPLFYFSFQADVINLAMVT
jgi:hypothetical protein